MQLSAKAAAPVLAGSILGTAALIALPAERADAYGLTDAEYNYCISSVSTAVNCYLTRVAADQAYDDTALAYGTNNDFGKPNAFQHAWWTILTAVYTGDREFAWEIVALHETGYPNWQTDNAHQMDLHNDRVGYHLAAPLMDPDTTLDDIQAVKILTRVKADSALQDSDGVNTDYTKLIYIS